MTNINPITKTDYPDPDVIRVDDTYYMISTTMYFLPGAVILRSYDLMNWEIASYVFDKLDDPVSCVLTEDESYYGKGMWAATLRYNNGKFYVAFVSHGQQCTHLYISDDVNGPWEHRKINEYFHDCSLLFDDERVFIVSGNTEIRLCELSDDLTEIKEGGIDRIIIRDDREKAMLGYEGAHFYKINGKYYISLIHWPKGGIRTQAVYVSGQVEGPYIGRDVLSDDMGFAGRGVAQGGFVDTPDGKWYAILFQDSGAIGRVPVLVEVSFEEDYPVFGENGIVNNNPIVKSLRPDYIYEALYTSDDFDYPEGNPALKRQWQWNHEPDNSLWRISNNKELCIKTGRKSINPVWAVNTLTQRMMMPSCNACVTVDAAGLNNGDVAGLIALQGCYGMIAITKENDKYYLVNLVRKAIEKPMTIGYTDPNPGEEAYKAELAESRVTLAIDAHFSQECDEVSFYVLNHDGDRQKIGDNHKLSFGLDHFTGARFGLCVFSTKEPGGEAAFSNFIYNYAE